MLRRNLELLAGAGRRRVGDPLPRRRRPQRAVEPDQGRCLRAAGRHPRGRGRGGPRRRDARRRGRRASSRTSRRPRGDGGGRATATSRTRRPRPPTTRPTTATCGSSRRSGRCSALGGRGVTGELIDASTQSMQTSTGGETVAVKAKIGVLVMALLEDDYNKTAHMRPAATAAAQEIADTARRVRRRRPRRARRGGAPGGRRRPAVQRRGRRHHRRDASSPTPRASSRPAACIDTTAPVLVWNTQKIRRLGEDDGFDVVMLNSRHGRHARAHRRPAPDRPRVRDGHLAASTTRTAGARVQRGRSRPPRSGAACARRGSRLVGHPFEGMTDLMFDGLSIRQEIGPVVWPLEPEKIAVRFGEIPQAEVDALVAAERARYTVEMEPALFERSVRLALALESVVEGARLRRLHRVRPGLADRSARRASSPPTAPGASARSASRRRPRATSTAPSPS